MKYFDIEERTVNFNGDGIWESYGGGYIEAEDANEAWEIANVGYDASGIDFNSETLDMYSDGFEFFRDYDIDEDDDIDDYKHWEFRVVEIDAEEAEGRLR